MISLWKCWRVRVYKIEHRYYYKPTLFWANIKRRCWGCSARYISVAWLGYNIMIDLRPGYALKGCG